MAPATITCHVRIAISGHENKIEPHRLCVSHFSYRFVSIVWPNPSSFQICDNCSCCDPRDFIAGRFRQANFLA